MTLLEQAMEKLMKDSKSFTEGVIRELIDRKALRPS